MANLHSSKFDFGGATTHNHPAHFITFCAFRIYKCNYNNHTIMEFEWDEKKRLANIRKRGIDFVDSEKIFAGYTLTAEDTSQDYGEQRFLTLGMLDGRVVSVCHTDRGEAMRIISIRKATKYEQKQYFKEFPNEVPD